jgi:hypothetical protein
VATIGTNQSDASGTITANAEAVDTVYHDHMEVYCGTCSPILCLNLLHSKEDNEPQISGIDFPLPQDASIPAHIIPSLVPHKDDESSYLVLFHVGSGVTCLVTNKSPELHCPTLSTATSGSTASAGARSNIDALGGTTASCPNYQFPMLLLGHPCCAKRLRF